MCQKCKNPICQGCPPPSVPPHLTDADIIRGGWNTQLTQEELDKLEQFSRDAVENPNQLFEKLNGKI